MWVKWHTFHPRASERCARALPASPPRRRIAWRPAGGRDADPRRRLLERAVPGSPPGGPAAAPGRPHWPPARRPAEAALMVPNRVRRTMKPMGTLDSVVHSDPEILGGTPVFRGTRVPVKNLLDSLAAGDSLDQFLDDFPTVKRDRKS